MYFLVGFAGVILFQFYLWKNKDNTLIINACPCTALALLALSAISTSAPLPNLVQHNP